ncbi:hypothetical protein C8F04DRAFT_1233993 [Mycena alexandri]|uniref:F-box domain-containing protein n=1 Tax=Mycena alexandri TaxID=1745969 RepID=A0AAD6X7A6_9AGAR|nr:hypothetical protein C8F04DRAFT_1233993 [Mycena alexandri]
MQRPRHLLCQMQFDPHVQFDAPAVHSPTGPRLPPEIQKIVVDILFDDKDTLGPCSLVDQAWLHLSRRHLFASIHLLNDRCESFRQLCDSPHATIAPYISTLSISSLEGADYMTESASFFLDHVPYLPSLPALTSLEISCLSWQNVSQQCLSSMARCFSNLTDLSIHLVEFRHSQQVSDLLSCFQMLEQVSIGATFATEDQASSSIPPPSLRYLRVLRLRMGLHGAGAFRDIISWCIPTNGLPAIQALSLASLDASLLPVVGSLLRELGPTLKDLDIWFMASVTVAEVNTDIDLTRNRGLRSLTVHNLDSQSWVLLEGISIDVLYVVIFVDSMEALDRKEWARLSWTPQFAGLRLFSLDVICFTPGSNNGSLDGDTVQREIRRRVPEWAEQKNTEIKLELEPVHKFYDKFMKFKSPVFQ